MNILRDPLVLIVVALLLGWGVYDAGQPPKPLPANVSDASFSAGRARSLLRELYPDNQPHVSGSPQNAALRERIVYIFKRFGYQPEIQKRLHCRPEAGICSPVENIITVHKGADSDSAILLAAHYDSSWSGPGAADDGAGVAAVLEIARMVKQQPEFAHDVIFLLTDAEEQGLLGADAFAREHPMFGKVRSVINLEARGMSGPSQMFETGEGNRRIVRIMAKHLRRPVTSSLSYEVYRRLPNDTDFSVFRKWGVSGVNFAFAGGAALYHSRMDDLQHLDPGSLQHHGQNAWAMLLALDERNIEEMVSSQDAVFIDIFGKVLPHFTYGTAVGMALFLSILVIFAIVQSYRRQLVPRQICWAAMSLLLLVIAVPATGWLLSWPLGHWVDQNPLEHPHPWLGRATLLLAIVWLIVRLLAFLAPRTSTGSLTAACWCFFVLLALVLSYALPAALLLALLPMLGFCLGMLFDATRWKKSPRLLFAGLFGFVAAAYLGIYYFYHLNAVLNFEHSGLMVIPLLLPAIGVLPLLLWYFSRLSGKGTPGYFLLVLVAAGCAGQQFVPGYEPGTPRLMNLLHWQSDEPSQAWMILESVTGKPDPVYVRDHGFSMISLPALDGEQRLVLARSAEPLNLPKIVEKKRSVVAGENASPHYLLELEIPEGVRLLSFRLERGVEMSHAIYDGQLAFDGSRRPGKWVRESRLLINRPAPGRHRFEFEFAGPVTAEVLLTARFDLPEERLQPYRADWPANAQPAFLGFRVLHNYRLTLGGD